MEIAVHYLTIMATSLVILYLLHVFSNVLQAMGIAVWALLSGFAEFFCRVFMAKVAIHLIGADALFISEPIAWIGGTALLLFPYLHYRKTLLVNKE